MDDLEREITQIKERNVRVEADKAWETSMFRIVLITVTTYVVMVLVMVVIEVNRPFVSALIPTLGYFISLQSLPLVKRWWIKKHYQKHNS